MENFTDRPDKLNVPGIDRRNIAKAALRGTVDAEDDTSPEKGHRVSRNPSTVRKIKRVKSSPGVRVPDWRAVVIPKTK